MNREIKFRGKRIDNGEWVYGCFAEFANYLDGDTKPGIQVTNQVPSGFDRMIPAFETELVEVIPETVGQYTGLKDKNGVEIYEGDILHWEDLSEQSDFSLKCNFEIFWDDEHLRWSARWTKSKIDNQELYDFTDTREIEVIGNIYENKELLDE